MEAAEDDRSKAACCPPYKDFHWNFWTVLQGHLRTKIQNFRSEWPNEWYPVEEDENSGKSPDLNN